MKNNNFSISSSFDTSILKINSLFNKINLYKDKNKIISKDDLFHKFKSSLKSGFSLKTKKSLPNNHSHGCIIFTIHNNKPYYLICQRKFTFEYGIIIRGLYNDWLLFKSLLLITPYERSSLLFPSSFKSLWVNYFQNDSTVNSPQYLFAEKKFSILQPLLSDLFSLLPSFSLSPEWTFPKGKSYLYESSLSTATRELVEETNFDLSSCLLLSPIPISFHHLGSNNIIYKSSFYVFYSPYKYTPSLQSNSEISSIQWFSFSSFSSLYFPSYFLYLLYLIDSILVKSFHTLLLS